MIVALLFAAAGAAAVPAPAPGAAQPALTAVDACKDAKSADILVCGKPINRFRIDSSVLEADRKRHAAQLKPPVSSDATAEAADGGCVGPDSCKGGVIPLIGMALVAAKAAELAATGGDWRDAIRTHDDEYRLYKEAEERKAKERGVKIGINVGNRR